MSHVFENQTSLCQEQRKVTHIDRRDHGLSFAIIIIIIILIIIIMLDY